MDIRVCVVFSFSVFFVVVCTIFICAVFLKHVTSGWIFEISLCANSINQSTKETYHTFKIIV